MAHAYASNKRTAEEFFGSIYDITGEWEGKFKEEELVLQQEDRRLLDVCGLWYFKIRIQFSFANFQSESAMDPVPTECKHSVSCLTHSAQI